MIRTPLQRSKPLQRKPFLSSAPLPVLGRGGLQRGTKLRAVSSKRTREQKQYAALRKAFLDEAYCKCGRVATVVQHRQGRGSKYLAVETWAPRCAACERDEHMHPKRSYETGDLLRRNSA